MNLKKLISFIFIVTFFSSFANGINYYGDLNIRVDSFGYVNINGITNYDAFKNITNSQKFVSKKDGKWLLNISSKVKFEDFIYELTLPENSKITYLKTTPNFRIEEEKGNLKIIGYGSNRTLNILLQYEVDNLKTTPIFNFETILIIILSLIITICLIVIFIMLQKIKKNNQLLEQKNQKAKKKTNKTKKKSSKKEIIAKKIDLNILSERQKQIIEILLKNKNKITQKELESQIKIPKSSLSRNLKTLEIKKIIKKETIGITNYISILEEENK